MKASEGDGRSPLLVVLAGVFTLLAVAAVAAAQSVPSVDSRRGVVDGGVYRRPLGHDPVTLDPALIGDVYSRSVANQIFDGLVQYDQTLAVIPALAEFWRASRDGLVWTFTLRKGVKFHHGREVTADDVVYSFTRLLDPRMKSAAADQFTIIKGAVDYRAGKARQVSGLVALDRFQVQVSLSEAPAPFVSLAAVGHAKIVPRDVAEAQGDAFGQRPVGTGPFRFVGWERGKEISLAANPDYFEGPPRLGRLVYRVFPGERFDTANDEFERGELEDSPLPPRMTPTEYRRIITDPRHLYVKRSMFSLRFYGLNTRIKPLDDRRVRQAINHAIDRESIVDGVYLGRSLLAGGVLPPGTPGYNPKLTGYAYNPARARELLAIAGYPGGKGAPSITIWSGLKDPVLREHELIRAALEAVGLRVEFSYQSDWPTYSKMLSDGKMPAFLYAWYADIPDPDNFLFLLFHSKSARNFTGYANPAVDETLRQARRAGDPQRRAELYRRAEQLIVDDAPIVPFWHYTYERRFQPYVKSVEVSGLGDPYIPLRKVWLERR
jgi:peptide/nickel transport system substrate-binding protein/oligopeptide transport system substrate-binding protein